MNLADYKPKAGQEGMLHHINRDGSVGVPLRRFRIVRVEGTLAYARYSPFHDPVGPLEEDVHLFIWGFERAATLNKCHFWPGHPDHPDPNQRGEIPA